MRTEQEIRRAFERFRALAHSAKRSRDYESYECCADLTMALGWVLRDEDSSIAVDEFLNGTNTINREDN